jgi:endoglucanase
MNGSIDLLKRLTEADGVPGFETEVRDAFLDEVGDGVEWIRDRMGSVIAKKPGTSPRPHVMLDCHLDEVGFIVQHITPTGFLKFLPLGGWWGHILPAQRVRVGAAGGKKIMGVIGSTPPHFLPAERRSQVLDVRDMFIDIGASSRAEAESWGVRVGTWAAPYSPFTPLENGDLLLAKAFDNRVGCALCIESVRDASDHPNTLFGSGSAQEEVGLRGARTAAETIDPDVAIVLECPPADDTPGFNPDETQGALGGGVQIRAYDPTMIANPQFVDFTLNVAREESIPHQLTVRASGGTNAGSIHVHDRGVPSVVIGVPARYIHSHTSILHTSDYAAAIRLTRALVTRLDADTVASFSAR